MRCIFTISKKHEDMTQLTVLELKSELKKLEELKIKLCDTPAFDYILDAIQEVKKTINLKSGLKQYNV